MTTEKGNLPRLREGGHHNQAATYSPNQLPGKYHRRRRA